MEALASFLLVGGATLLVLLVLYLLPNSSGSGSGRPRQPPLPPGPRGWPILGNLPQLGLKPHQSLAALSRTYGPLFRLRLGRENVVVAADSATASLFLKTHDANFSDRPSSLRLEILSYGFQNMVFAPYGPRWRMLRKLCSAHLFSAKALADFQHVRSEEASLLVRRLAGVAPESVINLGEEVNVCVANALGRVVLGRRVFAPGKEAAEFKQILIALMKLVGTKSVVDFVPELRWLDPQGILARTKSLQGWFDRFIDGLLAETASGDRKQQGSGAEGSLLSMLLALTDKEDVDGEGGRITHTNIKALASDLFAAGTDTTWSTVEWALAELIRQPEVLLELRRELDGVVGRDRLVSESDLPGLPFLQAVVKENFRLHPSTPLSLPHCSAESCEVAGYHIPKNTTLLVNLWAIARDPKVWSDPLEFRPERFLPGGERPDADVRGNHMEVIPFGAGRRICAGMSLGVRMVQFLVATLAHAFEWEAQLQGKEALDMEEAFGLTLHRAQPLLLRPVPRLLPSAYVA